MHVFILKCSQSECVLGLICVCVLTRAQMCVALVCIAKPAWVLQRLTLRVHINGVVVEMESSSLLHIPHAIIPLASQCASSVIRWKQTLLLSASGCRRDGGNIQAHILTFIARGLESFQQIMH